MATVENGIALLHCEDFTDALGNCTITNNNAIISTEQHKFGSSSLYFNKDNSSYISIALEHLDAYSIEFWFYPILTQTSNYYPCPVSTTTTNGNGGTYIFLNDSTYSNNPVYRANTTASGNTGGYGSTVITSNEWHHMAICKSGSNHYFFLDGNLERTVTQSSSNTITAWYLGAKRRVSDMQSNAYYTGYIDEILITSECKWSSSFTVPTEAYSTDVNINNIKLGVTTINDIYLGNTKIKKVYIGETLVFKN